MKKKLLALALITVLVLSVTACGGKDEPEETVEPEVTIAMNPLTGETAEDGFDESALNRRVTAFVVENAPDARPQWGMDDPEYSPDIIVQGEVEGGITRTLWLYADYNKLPEIIGPMRSARPPFIKFSELFDSIFIHWGMSFTKGDYIGANTIFKRDKVDHINQMTYNDTVGLYDRDHTRSVSMEHRGILYGAKVPQALDESGFRLEPNEYTTLSFNPLAWMTEFKPANDISVAYSSITYGQGTQWTYNAEDNKYHTSSFRNDLSRDNLLILYDTTEYVTKYNYHNTGSSVTYCNYNFDGGYGQLFHNGVVKDIEWKVEDGKLVLTDTRLTKLAQEAAQARLDALEEAGEEIPEGTPDPSEIVIPASLAKGKTWIGLISRNNGGSVTITN